MDMDFITKINHINYVYSIFLNKDSNHLQNCDHFVLPEFLSSWTALMQLGRRQIFSTFVWVIV